MTALAVRTPRVEAMHGKDRIAAIRQGEVLEG